MTARTLPVVSPESLEVALDIIRQVCSTVNIVVLTQSFLEAKTPLERENLSRAPLTVVEALLRPTPIGFDPAIENEEEDQFESPPHPRSRW